MSPGRDARGMRGRLGDDIRHRSLRAKLYSEFDNDEMSCVCVIRIYRKAVVDFFRGIFSSWSTISRGPILLSGVDARKESVHIIVANYLGCFHLLSSGIVMQRG
jgi:hypothetical protein